jgi:hypothetical protein
MSALLSLILAVLLGSPSTTDVTAAKAAAKAKAACCCCDCPPNPLCPESPACEK